MRSKSNTTHEDNDKFTIYKNSAIVSVIILFILLMTGCSSILADEIGMELRKEPETEEVKTRWKVLSGDNYWSGSIFTIGRDELIVRNPMEDRGGLVTTTLALRDSKEIEGLRETGEVLYYEVYFTDAERGMYADDIERLQKGGFDTYETEDELILSTENPEVVAKFSHISEASLHLYESDEVIEVVSVNYQYPAVFQAIPYEASKENRKYTYVMELYSQLHKNLSEKNHEGVASARTHMDELLDILPESKVAPMFIDLIDDSEAYLTAVNQIDEKKMTNYLNLMAERPYANLYGLVDDYTVLHETLMRRLETVRRIDKQIETIVPLIMNENYEEAEVKLTKIDKHLDFLTTYYPEKAERLKLLKTQLKDNQNSITHSDFNGYWGTLDDSSISDLGKYILYISDNYYSIGQYGTDLLALTQIESAVLDESTLQLNIFEKRNHLNKADTRTSLKVGMVKNKDGKRLTVSIDNEKSVFYPLPAEEVINETGMDIEARGNELYQ